MVEKKEHFRVTGKIARLLGRESVSEPIVALFEVLKNSHDADALSATVKFSDILTGTGKIVIREKEGDGMTYSDIVDKFLVIGTYSKEAEEEKYVETKRHKRKVLGSKGVGRFALETLGREVTIVSKPIGSDDKYTFTINWDKFEPRDITIDQVGITIRSEKRTDKDDSGLEIEISRLRDSWDKKKIDLLASKIQRLILPKEFQNKKTFKIVLDAPEFGYNNQLITVDLAKRAYYKLEAILNESEIAVKAWVKDELVVLDKDNNDVVLRIKDFEPHVKNLVQTETEKSTGRKFVKEMTCGPTKLQVYYFPNFQKKTFRYRDSEAWYGEGFSSFLTELPKYSGVRIFRDGLRAFTYGDPDRDWVDRAYYTRMYGHTVPADRLVGYVLISNEHNSQIKETTNRESAIEDQAFLDLEEFVIQSMFPFDQYLNKLLKAESKEEKKTKRKKEALNKMHKALSSAMDPKSRLSKAISKSVGTPQDASKEFNDLVEALKDSREIIEYSLKKEEQEMTQNQIEIAMKSLGYIVAEMNHQVGNAIEKIAQSTEKLREHVIGEKRMTDNDLNKLIFKLEEFVNTLTSWHYFVKNYSSGLTVKDYDSRIDRVFNPYTVTQGFVENAREVLNLPHLDIKNLIDPRLEIRMFGVFFEGIIGNLMTNSIKAINSLPDKEQRENLISIRSERTEHELILFFSDNGPGIPKEMWNTIFEPHVSTTSNDPLFPGQGLGLTTARSMLRYYDGDIEVVEPIHGQGASFRIRIPWENIDPKSTPD